MEQIQKTFLRITFRRGHPHSDTPSYEQLLKLYKLEALEDRRIKADLILFQKNLYGQSEIEQNTSNNIIRIVKTITRGEEYKFQQTSSFRNNALNHSFFVRTLKHWNKLPIRTRRNHPKDFKKLLDCIQKFY